MRLNSFGYKFLAVAAMGLFLAACEKAPENAATTGGSGSSSTMSTGSSTAGIQSGSVQDFQVNVGDRVFFDFDKSTLSSKAQATLDKQAAWLKRVPTATILVEGHCDERGTREYNLALGDRRATAVKDYLVSKGIAASRIKTISYGKERPAVLCRN